MFVLRDTTGSEINEPFSRQALLLGMCDKCAKLDEKIEHYETILVSIGDRVTVERLHAMIADLQAQKVALHPEPEQKQ